MSESITCPKCGMTSYSPDDIREGYCGNCHDYTATLISAEDAIFQTDLLMHDMTDSQGPIGTLTKDEAIKVAQHLFGEDLPEDIKAFFEGSS